MDTIIRRCAKCLEKKKLNSFPKDRTQSLVHGYVCRGCEKQRMKEYGRTKGGLITRIYHSQIGNSKTRGMKLPSYTKEELVDWLNSQGLFHELHARWIKSEYKAERRPSVDRIDDYIGYNIDNIQLMTWGENRDKSHQDRKSGKNKKQCRGVVATSEHTRAKIEFHSISEAARQLGIAKSNIISCCKGKRLKAGGYKWEYSR